MILTAEQITRIDPHIRISDISKYIEQLNAALDYFDIDSTNRVSAFLAQCIHESNFFRATAENLNYSDVGLMKTFNTKTKQRFPSLEFAQQYARKPEKIANYVYANRNGNGNEASGDGWRFRGQGLIQLTFRDTYQAYSDFMKDPSIMQDPSQLQVPYDACYSACWFFVEYKDLLPYADRANELNFNQISYRVNGGWNGKEERVRLWNACRRVLS